MQDANRDTGWTWKRIEKWHNFETRRTSRSRVAEREQAKAQFCTERQESSRARQLWRKSTSLFMSIIGDISTFKSESPFCSPSFPNLFQVQLEKKTWRKSSWIFSPFVITDGESFNFPTTSTAMMTGSLPSSSSSSTTSSTGSSRQTNEDQFVDDLVSRLIKEDAEDDLVTGLNSLLKQWVAFMTFVLLSS